MFPTDRILADGNAYERGMGGGSTRLNGPECRHSTVSYHCQDDLEMKAMDFRRYEKWETTGISH